MVVSIDSHSENPRFPVQLVDTHSFVPTALTPHPANTGVSEMWCWCVSLPHIHLRGNSTANQPAHIRLNTLQPFNFCFDDFHAPLPNSHTILPTTDFPSPKIPHPPFCRLLSFIRLHSFIHYYLALQPQVVLLLVLLSEKLQRCQVAPTHLTGSLQIWQRWHWFNRRKLWYTRHSCRESSWRL